MSILVKSTLVQTYVLHPSSCLQNSLHLKIKIFMEFKLLSTISYSLEDSVGHTIQNKFLNTMKSPKTTKSQGAMYHGYGSCP